MTLAPREREKLATIAMLIATPAAVAALLA